MLKNAFHFILKALVVLKIFKFFVILFGHLGKRLDKKSKIYDVINWETNNYYTHIAQYLKN